MVELVEMMLKLHKNLPKAKTAQLWGLTAADLVEIQKNLKELTE